ncbi:CBS domain-containing protein [Haloarchaeobius iranensis]|uniref:CBS domain-containing protein n=1 Tax=Haloarchaeobius iranensis TaxID=996166 RepID=A0A1G9SAJ5_9EURY|nr:CBS domain-containing protein [Haloarchaeobius iranensis]SDM32494.1 CBS domain-containing protein [Haloarchaeobius iranensis]
MQVREIMSNHPVSVDEDEPVRTAVELMVDGHIGSVVVTRQGDAKPYKVGILTRSDVLALECEDLDEPAPSGALTRLVDRLRSSSRSQLDEVTVGEVMSSPLVTVSPKTAVEEAIRLMEAEDVRHVVVTEQLRAIGVVTPTDVMEHHPEAVELARRHGARGPEWDDR